MFYSLSQDVQSTDAMSVCSSNCDPGMKVIVDILASLVKQEKLLNLYICELIFYLCLETFFYRRGCFVYHKDNQKAIHQCLKQLI